MPGSLKVFLCHSSSDKPAIRKLYQYLIGQGIDAWLDEEKLLPGQNWDLEISKAVRDADAFIVCLSKASVTKEGYLQKEIKFALDIADEKPEEVIFIIPARLDDCEVPYRLKKWHWVDIFDGTNYDKVLASLAKRAGSLGRGLPSIHTMAHIETPKWGDMEFVLVPAGSFIMGSKITDAMAADHEKPEAKIELSYAYYIGKYPVTNAQFSQFIVETKPKNADPADWQRKRDHPATNVTWFAAQDFCRWLNNTLGNGLPAGWQICLPTEAEWEKAARGEHGNIWPWGNEWKPDLCNSKESNEGETTRVGYYSLQGNSPYGVVDMAGNVWEWTLSLWGTDINRPEHPYPNNAMNVREMKTAETNVCRILRGGSFQDLFTSTRCTSRRAAYPLTRWAAGGFRIVICPKST